MCTILLGSIWPVLLPMILHNIRCVLRSPSVYSQASKPSTPHLTHLPQILTLQLATVTGNEAGMVRIHLDDQMDAKSLLGAYVCTAVPGEFAWQPGPLTQVYQCGACLADGGMGPLTVKSLGSCSTMNLFYCLFSEPQILPLRPFLLHQAVVEGRWVVIEDANMAPPDVLAALVPLLESRTLALPSRGEVIEAAPGFQLLATVTSAPGSGASGEGSGGGGAYGSSQMVKVRDSREDLPTLAMLSQCLCLVPQLHPMLCSLFRSALCPSRINILGP